MGELTWRIWADGQDEDGAREVQPEAPYEEEDAEAIAEDLAENYCARLEDHGYFAGDPYPDTIDIYLIAPTGTRYVVSVRVDFSVDFIAGGVEVRRG